MDTPTQQIPLDAITRDPLQPRKEFDQAKLEQLADSIRLHGVLEPIMVRPVKAAGQEVPSRFILIFGERRFLASQKAKLGSIPAIVRDVGEDHVTALQLEENDQRVDLKALERSNAHQQMLKRGLSVEQIARETSTSPATVRDSLKLQDLVPEVRKAWGTGQIDYSKALLIAKVPGQLQPEVLADALEENVDGEVMSFRQLKEHVYRSFLLELKKAPFAVADAQLVPAAGSCNNCPTRTAAQPDFFSDVKADFCLNRICFQGKCDARLVAAEKAGAKVLGEAEAKEVFSYGQARPDYNSDYVLADEKPHGSKKSFGGMVDKSDVVLAKAPGGQIVELVLRSALPRSKEDEASGSRKKDPAQVKLDQEYAVRVETAKAVREELLDAVASKKQDDVTWMRAALGAMLSTARTLPKNEIFKRRGWDKTFNVAKLIDTCDAQGLRDLIFDLAFAERITPWRHTKGYPAELVEACKLLDVDLKKLERESKAALDDKLKAKAAKKLATVKEVVEAKKGKRQVVDEIMKLSAEVKGKHATKEQRQKFRKLADEAGLSKPQTSAETKTASGKKRKLPIKDEAAA